MKRRSLYATYRWKALRLRALERDRWRCRLCGRAGRLEVHHVRPTFRGGAMWDLGNLRSLCRDCHFKIHKPDHEAARRAARSPGRRAWWEFIDAAT